MTAIHHEVVPHDPAAHRFHVTLTVPEPGPDGTQLRLPSWIPGSYTIRDFARHIIAPTARDERGPVALHRHDKDTWRAEAAQGPLVVTYEVYAWELTVRTAHLDQTHGFFNGTSLLLSVVGQENRPHRLTLSAGDDPACAGWRVATTLPRVSGSAWDFGTFEADSYDALVDHPVEMGTFDLVRFEARGVVHHIAVTGSHRGDLDRLARDVQAICETHLDFFGAPAPVQTYLFQLTVVGDGYGGLEHRASTALIAKRDDLPFAGMDKPTDGYANLLGLFSHEYFHTWNVKRIKPAAFVPYDYNTENHTTLLWAFEGITSYYDDLGCLRAGRIDTRRWLTQLGRTITRVRRAPGLDIHPLVDSSFDAWTKLYKSDENSPNVQVSYYSKGALAALALDLRLRRDSDERVGLDEVMAALWTRYGDGSGVPEDGVEALVAEVSGLDLAGFFDQTLRGTGRLPLEELLAWVGLTLKARPATGPDDRGGTAPKSDAPAHPSELGATLAAHKHGVKLSTVRPGGAAHQAGLSAGDVLVAVDHLKADKKRLATWLDRTPPGTAWTVHAFRRDELRVAELTLQPRRADTWYLELDEAADSATVARRNRWLRVPAS